MAEGQEAHQSGEAVTDGRALRRLRNREAVVEAILALLNEGETQITAQLVSQRSGVSIRSIFRLFEDMEALHRLAIARQAERVLPLIMQLLPLEGTLTERVEGLVAKRTEIFEVITPVRRQAVRAARVSKAVRAELDRFGRFFRLQLSTAFAPELETSADPETLLEALDAVTSWEAWERLRAGQGLAVDGAARAMALTVTGLLTRAAEGG